MFGVNGSLDRKTALQQLQGSGIRIEVLDAALYAFQVAWNDPPRIDHGVTVKVTKQILMVVDFTLPGTQVRFWLFDLASMQLWYALHCSHGKNSESDPLGTPSAFSNTNNSYKSS